MVLNFTDPFLTTRVLGFESLFDRLQRFSETTERSSSYPPYNIRRDQNKIFIDFSKKIHPEMRCLSIFFNTSENTIFL